MFDRALNFEIITKLSKLSDVIKELKIMCHQLFRTKNYSQFPKEIGNN